MSNTVLKPAGGGDGGVSGGFSSSTTKNKQHLVKVNLW